jgi:hypothetical protein
MADLNGGQLIWAGTSGAFSIVTEAWFPLEDALTQLWFGNDLEYEDTKVSPGDSILNPAAWATTTHQVEMWFLGDRNHNGVLYDDAMEGFESNLNYWRTELLDPTVVARNGTLILPSGEERYAVGSKFRLTGKGRRRPSGWPLMFEFQLTEPFTVGGS